MSTSTADLFSHGTSKKDWWGKVKLGRYTITMKGEVEMFWDGNNFNAPRKIFVTNPQMHGLFSQPTPIARSCRSSVALCSEIILIIDII